MKRKILSGIFISFLLFTIVLSVFYLDDNERNKYERYLIKDIRSLYPNYNSESHSKVMMDKPEMAGIQDYYMTIDPKLKRVPHERLVEAIKLTKSKAAYKSDLADRYSWTEVPSNMGGRVRSLMFDPNDENHQKIWAGSVTGGLWYTTNLYSVAKKWIPVSDIWENLSISSIVYDPNNPQIFYVGTGEAQTAVTIYRESSTRGVGIWKTTDAGSTWELLPSTSKFHYISDLIVKDEDGISAIYAGVVSGTYQGEDHLSNPSDGLFKSIDGGENWIQVLPNITGQDMPYSPSDIELSANGRIFVGTYRNIQGFGGATILYSDNGSDWIVNEHYCDLIKTSTDPSIVIPGRTILSSSPSSPNTVYAVIAAGGYNEDNFIFYRGRFILKSTDNGFNWSIRNLPMGSENWATLSWHALVLKVDPKNENVLYAGGLNMHKTTDGGSTWTELSSWYNYGPYYDPSNKPYLHADQHCIAFKPESSDTVCFSNDGGVFTSFNASNENMTFAERSQSLNTLQFYTCDINPDTMKLEFLGGLQDNGTTMYYGVPLDNAETMISGGDGAYCFFDEEDYIISSVYYNGYYVYKKQNDSYEFQSYIFDDRSGTFISPADYNSKTNTMFANAVSFTFQQKDQIFKLSNAISPYFNVSFIHVNTGSNVYFSHVKVSEYSSRNNSTLFLGTVSGKLFKVNNAETTISTVNIGSDDFPTANISCIAEGKDQNELLVTFSNYGVSSIWYTNDGGSSWAEKEGDLIDMPVRWVLFDPIHPDTVLIATEVGIWATPSITAENVEWEPVVNNLANVRVDMLKLRRGDNKILAATHGRGLFYCDLPGNSSITVGINDQEISDKANIQVYPNPTSGFLQLEMEHFSGNSIHISIYNEIGSVIKMVDLDSRTGKVNLDISELTNGIYFINVQTDNQNYIQKIIKE